MHNVTEKCENRCGFESRGGRSVYWCGYGTNTPGEKIHGEHDWYSYVYGQWEHCYGTGA